MSIIDQAHKLLMESEISYQKISDDTGIPFKWLLNFNLNYKKGRDMWARRVEKLIAYLTKKEVLNEISN